MPNQKAIRETPREIRWNRAGGRSLASEFWSRAGEGKAIGSPTKAGPPQGPRRRQRSRRQLPVRQSKPRRQLPVRRSRRSPQRKPMQGKSRKNSNLQRSGGDSLKHKAVGRFPPPFAAAVGLAAPRQYAILALVVARPPQPCSARTNKESTRSGLLGVRRQLDARHRNRFLRSPGGGSRASRSAVSHLSRQRDGRQEAWAL